MLSMCGIGNKILLKIIIVIKYYKFILYSLLSIMTNISLFTEAIAVREFDENESGGNTPIDHTPVCILYISNLLFLIPEIGE